MNRFARRWHKPLGLFAASWLLVLGITGFLLDHRDWRWMWQSTVSESWLPDSVVKKSRGGSVRLFRVLTDRQMLAAGPRGLWWSDAAGNWHKTNTASGMPMINAMLFVGNRLWLATDDGLWISKDKGRSIRPHALAAIRLTAINQGSEPGEILLVEDRSRVWRYDSRVDSMTPVPLFAPESRILPKHIDLSRFVHDLHFGRGVFDIPVSLLWSDITGLALFILPLTGFLFWYLPRRWARKAREDRPGAQRRKQGIRWLYRLHGPLLGVVVAIPVVYLSITGIFLDHRQELRGWMKSVAISQSLLPPVYALSSWQGEIRDVIGYPDNHSKISLATRYGVLTSNDSGRSWWREKTGSRACFVVTLRRLQGTEVAGGMGCSNFVRRSNGAWKPLRKTGHMPSDISIDDNGSWYWKSRRGIVAGKPGAGFRPLKVSLPQPQGVPWYYILDALHSGLIFHKQWKWINDLFALLAILLVITGLVRWWKVKWI